MASYYIRSGNTRRGSVGREIGEEGRCGRTVSSSPHNAPPQEQVLPTNNGDGIVVHSTVSSVVAVEVDADADADAVDASPW